MPYGCASTLFFYVSDGRGSSQLKTDSQRAAVARRWRESDNSLPSAEILGVESPLALSTVDVPLRVVRGFAFVDLCAFTAFTDSHGPLAARDVLVAFRQAARHVAERRGVRIAKWMGDGALLVAVEPAAVVACAVDIVGRIHTEELDVRAGVSTGPALLIDGDDYVGRSLNLASRLCDIAPPGTVLADSDSCRDLPDWIVSKRYASVTIKGIGRRRDILQLSVGSGAEAPLWALPA